MLKQKTMKRRGADDDEQPQQEQKQHARPALPKGQQPPMKMTKKVRRRDQDKENQFLATVKSVKELNTLAFKVFFAF
jgi:hypothetical protein